jgi:crotonobetainyl-CoA:carnitine CoA-transferase CaiB-like acyl-CoA transferase
MTHSREATAVIAELFSRRTFGEAQELLAAGRGAWAPVAHPREVLSDPQILANGYLQDVTDSAGRPFRLVPAPLQFNEEPGDTRRAPDHGEHTDEVLAELGLSTEEVLEFKITGAVL